MGTDTGDALSEFEKEAGEVWDMLNDLRESDGDAYDAFVRSQMAAGAEMMAAASTSTSASAGKAAGAASAELPPGLIRPERGFVIKTTATRRLAPPKGPPKGGAGGSGDVERRKLFVNFCSHRSIQRPLDGAGRPVEDEDDDNAGADIQEVPMVLSKLRDVRDAAGLRAWAVDVVLHPRCVERCRETDGGAFRARLVRLGLTWAGRERGLSVATGDGEWKAIGARYKGGLGEKGRGVHPLPIGVGGDGDGGTPGASGGRPTDVAGGPSAGQGGDPSPVDVVTGDPSELLRRMRSEDSSAAEEGEGRGLSLSAAEIRGGIDSRPLIRDISATKTSRRPPPLKKEMRGFLNRKGGRKMPLYKGKSSGDGSSGTGGSYARLMSRCKVVDGAGVVNAERGGAARAPNDSMKKGGGGGDDNAPFPSPSDSFEGLGNIGFLRKRDDLFDGTVAAAPDGGEEEEEDSSGTFDAKFRDLMEKVDPNLARSFADGAQTKAEGAGEMMEDAAATLEELSRALAEGSDEPRPPERGGEGAAGKEERDQRRDDGAEAAEPPAPAEPPSPAPKCEEEARAAEGRRAAAELPRTVAGDGQHVTVDIDLSPCTGRGVDLDALELEASENRLRLKAPCGRLLFSHEFDRPVDSERLMARLRRRRQRLQVIIPLE